MAKPRKVQEPAASYDALPKKPLSSTAITKTDVTGSIRYADQVAFQKAASKVFKTHAELFRKLAQ